jgi:membrane protein DedA with SNARE-associated domain
VLVLQKRTNAKEATFLLTNLTNTITLFIQHLYMTMGLAGIVLAMAIESCCIPLPSEIVMPLAGIMIYNGTILKGTNPWIALLMVAVTGAIGCLIGSIVAYFIGYKGGRPLMLKYGRYVLISQHDADKADRFFQRWGSATTFFSRLLPVVRTYISLPAGIAKMPFAKFCVFTVLGSLPWCFVLAFAGYKIGSLQNSLGSVFHGLDIVIVVLFVLLVALYIWRHIRNDQKAREALAASQAASTIQASQQNSWMQTPAQQGQSWNQPQSQSWNSAQGQGYSGQQGYPQQSQQQWGQGQFQSQQVWGQPQQSPQQPQPLQPQSPQPWNQYSPQQSWGQAQAPQSTQAPQPQSQPWNSAQNQFPPQQAWGQPFQPKQSWPAQNGDNDPTGQRR